MKRRIGYGSLSKENDHQGLQRDALLGAGCIAIFEEEVSGRASPRLALERCRKALRPGDTLVVWRLDRLGRSLQDLVKIVAELGLRGIDFESLCEKIETESTTGKITFHLFAALSDFDRNLMIGRAKSGLVAARARGRAGGRKPKLNEHQVQEIKVLLRDPGVRVSDIARRYGVSRTTLYKHVGVISPRK